VVNEIFLESKKITITTTHMPSWMGLVLEMKN
jgi:hypothetical protein